MSSRSASADRPPTPAYRPSMDVDALKIGGQSLALQDLLMIKAMRGYSWLYWRDGRRQLMAYTLKHYAAQLPTADFIRVHQNCVINRHFVQTLRLTHRGPLLRLVTGAEVIVARRRWSMVKRALPHLYGM